MSGSTPASAHSPLEEILEDLVEGIQVIDREYRYVYVNPAVARQARTTADALIGRRMADCFPGIERTPMFAELTRVMESREPTSFENPFTFPDGSHGWFELHLEPVSRGVAILSLEISARKDAEARLLRTHRALRTLSRCNQTMVRARDAGSLIASICEILVETGGYSAAAVIGPRRDDGSAVLLGQFPAETGLFETSAVRELTEQCAREGRAVIADVPEHERGGLPIGSWMAQPLIREGGPGALLIGAAPGVRFEAGETELLWEVALDLGHGLDTLRTRIELEDTATRLATAQAAARSLFEHLPSMAFVWRFRDGAFALEDFNLAARGASEPGLEALRGRSADEIAGGLPHARTDLETCLSTGAVVRREVDGIAPGGSVRRRLVLSYGPSPPDRVILHARDVTEQRLAEEQLVVSQRLEAVGRLAGGAAHDFNNLLSVILSYCDFVLDELPEHGQAREDALQIRGAAERAATLTRGLLAFSRKQILDPRVVDLRDVLERIKPMLRGLLREDVALQLHPGEGVGCVRIDVSQLEQVIMNLAANAGDAMPDGGTLTLETANVTLDEEYGARHEAVVPGPYVMLSCTDTGEGMDSETRSHIFEPFFTTKPKDKGTGLGLSVVYGIVKQSGGHIWVYSEPGQGTTFKVYLPRVATAADAQNTPVRRSATGGECVLVVEDEDAVRGAAVRILRGAGFEVLAANGGPAAIELAAAYQGSIDLLLTDVVMPGMSGRVLAEHLILRRPGLRVLFTSGYTDNAILHQRLVELGAHFIAKPFSAVDLTNKVRSVLDEGG